MKSLLQILPEEEEVAFWNLRIRTNLTGLKTFAEKNRGNHPILSEMADLLAEIEKWGAWAGKASAILEGRTFRVTVSPQRGHGTPARTQRRSVKVIQCKMCKHLHCKGHEQRKDSHRRGCPIVLALEVMEG